MSILSVSKPIPKGEEAVVLKWRLDLAHGLDSVALGRFPSWYNSLRCGIESPAPWPDWAFSDPWLMHLQLFMAVSGFAISGSLN